MWRTLLVAVSGGSIAHWLGLPLAWLVGGLWATIAFSTVAKTTPPPTFVRRLALAIIGCYLGASFTPNFIDELPNLLIVLLAVFLCVMACSFGGIILCKVFLRTTNNTALIGSVPGGLTIAIAAMEKHPADKHTVILHQLIRVIFFASILPLFLRLIYDSDKPIATVEALSVDDTTWLVAAFLVSAGVGWRLNSGIAYLLTAIICTGALYANGLASGQIPWFFLAAAQMVIGVTAGTRLTIGTLKQAKKTAAVAAATAVLYTIIALIFAGIAAQFDGPPFLTWFLVFIPGGIAEISLLAQLLDLNPVFVLTTQIARLFFIALLIPPLMRRFSTLAP